MKNFLFLGGTIMDIFHKNGISLSQQAPKHLMDEGKFELCWKVVQTSSYVIFSFSTASVSADMSLWMIFQPVPDSMDYFSVSSESVSSFQQESSLSALNCY